MSNTYQKDRRRVSAEADQMSRKLSRILRTGILRSRLPGVTLENAARQPPRRAGLTPENAELLAEYGGYLERSHLAGPSRYCGRSRWAGRPDRD